MVKAKQENKTKDVKPKKTATTNSQATNEQKAELKSKEDLIQLMNSHLDAQQKMAETLRVKALKYMNVDDSNGENKKQRNQFIYSYNQQVEAVCKTVTSLIRIQGSTLKNEKELDEENGEKEVGLVD